jgi:hypothetical protein
LLVDDDDTNSTGCELVTLMSALMTIQVPALERNRFGLNRDFAQSICSSHDLVRKSATFRDHAFSGSCSKDLSIAEHTMSSSGPILDLATVGEVAAVFHSQKDIDVAVNALMLSGFDRSQADVIDSLDQLRQKPENVGLEKLAAVTLI